MNTVDKSRFIINFEMSEKRSENSDLSLIVKERDVEYQVPPIAFFCVALFSFIAHCVLRKQ